MGGMLALDFLLRKIMVLFAHFLDGLKLLVSRGGVPETFIGQG